MVKNIFKWCKASKDEGYNSKKKNLSYLDE